LTPKEYFTQLLDLDDEIDSKLRERDHIMSTLIRSTDTTQEPIYTNTPSSPVEDTVIKLLKYNDDTNKKVDKLVDLRIQIAEEISQLKTKNYRRVLRERYIQCNDWEKVADNMDYDLRWTHRLHQYALEEFEQTFPKKFK